MSGSNSSNLSKMKRRSILCNSGHGGRHRVVVVTIAECTSCKRMTANGKKVCTKCLDRIEGITR